MQRLQVRPSLVVVAAAIGLCHDTRSAPRAASEIAAPAWFSPHQSFAGVLAPAVADSVVPALVADGPTAEEIERGRRQAEASFIYRLQTLGGFGGRADQLNGYNVYCGTPGFFDGDLQRYLDVESADVSRAAALLTPAGSTTVSVVPAGQPGAALKGSAPIEAV